jgi:hypothetical protein
VNNSQFAVQHYVAPIKKDFKHIAKVYDHKDSHTTVGRSAKTRSGSSRAASDEFLAPTSLPAIPSGLESRETVTVRSLDDAWTVVTLITWAEE